MINPTISVSFLNVESNATHIMKKKTRKKANSTNINKTSKDLSHFEIERLFLFLFAIDLRRFDEYHYICVDAILFIPDIWFVSWQMIPHHVFTPINIVE